MRFRFGWRSIVFVGGGVISALLLVLASSSLHPLKAATVAETHLRAVPDNLYGVSFADTKHGLVSGYYGTVLRTVDGGKTWRKIETGVTELLRRVEMVSPSVAFAVGHRGVILKSEDGGLKWRAIHREKGIYLRDISFADPDNGWVVGHDSVILHTTDGGKTWVHQKLEGYTGRDLPRLHGIVALTPTHALAVGEFGVIVETIDGGQHWKLLNSPTKKTLTAVDATQDRAIAVGLDGEALEIFLDNGAKPRVRQLDTGQSAHLFDIALNGTGQGVAVGSTVLLSLNGETFSKLPAAEDVALPYTWFSGVNISPDGEVWMAGLRGIIAHADHWNTQAAASYFLGAPAKVSKETAHVE